MADDQEELLDYEGEEQEQQQSEQQAAASEQEEPAVVDPAETAEEAAGSLADDEPRVAGRQPPAAAAAAGSAGASAPALKYKGFHKSRWSKDSRVAEISGLKPVLGSLLRSRQPGAAVAADRGLAVTRGSLSFCRLNVAIQGSRMHTNLGRLLSPREGAPLHIAAQGEQFCIHHGVNRSHSTRDCQALPVWDSQQQSWEQYYQENASKLLAHPCTTNRCKVRHTRLLQDGETGSEQLRAKGSSSTGHRGRGRGRGQLRGGGDHSRGAGRHSPWAAQVIAAAGKQQGVTRHQQQPPWSYQAPHTQHYGYEADPAACQHHSCGPSLQNSSSFCGQQGLPEGHGEGQWQPQQGAYSGSCSAWQGGGMAAAAAAARGAQQEQPYGAAAVPSSAGWGWEAAAAQQQQEETLQQPVVDPPRSSNAALAAEVAGYCKGVDPNVLAIARMSAAIGALSKDKSSLKRQLDRAQDVRAQQTRRLE